MLSDQENYKKAISDPYELMISKEDYEGRLTQALTEIADFRGKDVVDLGAGTGRYACMFAPVAKSVTAVDFAADMLRVAADKLAATGLTHWKTVVADHRELPLAGQSADIVLSGWSICYLGSSDQADWQRNIRLVMNEIGRVLRPGGTVIITETLGTGSEEPVRPEGLQAYYRELEQTYGFEHRAVRTDYRFDSVEQAETLCRNFFGDALGNRIRAEGLRVVPENTGIWWRTSTGSGAFS